MDFYLYDSKIKKSLDKLLSDYAKIDNLYNEKQEMYVRIVFSLIKASIYVNLVKFCIKKMKIL